MERAPTPPRGPLQALAWFCIGSGVILMLAMSFGLMPPRIALFLGTSAFVVGGLLWGSGDRAADAAPSRDQGPTVSRREP